jgi:hypothetical protein
MNYLQWGVYEQCTGCVKIVGNLRVWHTTVILEVLAFLTKENVDSRYDISLCVSEACDQFILASHMQ